MKYWLLKTEPEDFSIQDLERCPNQTTFWHGVRNYQARNYLRDEMRRRDRVLLYHSNANPPAVVGIAQVVREAYPDPTALDKNSPYFDPQSTADNPRWVMVDIRLQTTFADPLPLAMLHSIKALSKMELLRRGSRLSVQPVAAGEFKVICKLAQVGT